MTEATLSIANQQEILDLFGPRDQHLRRIRRLFDVNITQRDGRIRIAGQDAGVQSAARTLERLRKISRRNGGISPGDVDQAAFDEVQPSTTLSQSCNGKERFPRVRVVGFSEINHCNLTSLKFSYNMVAEGSNHELPDSRGTWRRSENTI